MEGIFYSVELKLRRDNDDDDGDDGENGGWQRLPGRRSWGRRRQEQEKLREPEKKPKYQKNPDFDVLPKTSC